LEIEDKVICNRRLINYSLSVL